MVRKRGKSRLSTAEKRIASYGAKYTADSTTKRYKVLLPKMYPQLKQSLINWDFLEAVVFPRFEELGIPEVESPYYLAWVKRKAEKGLTFRDATRLAEYQLLKQEFVQRGLNPDFLDAVEPFVDLWVETIWGTLLHREEWSYSEPPTFTLQHSEAWSS